MLALAGAVLLAPGASARAESPQTASVKTQKTNAPRRSTRASRASRALREAMTPRYKRDASGDLVPDVRAEAAIIFDPETGRVLWSENAHDQRSIASITKVMTALVFLEDDPDLTQTVTVTRADTRRASTTYLRTNEKLTLHDVLNVTLVASDNAGARVLADHSHGGIDAFVERMNEKAIELGLEDTHFADPSGLDPDNVSSAYDLSRLIAFAGHDARIAAIMQQPDYQFSTSRRRLVRVRNTNKLVGQLDVVSGKTGLHPQGGLLPGDPPQAAGRRRRGRRRPRRLFEPRALLGDAASLQLAEGAREPPRRIACRLGLHPLAAVVSDPGHAATVPRTGNHEAHDDHEEERDPSS